MKGNEITTKPQGYELNLYEPPTIEIFNISIEKGFAASGVGTENWNETPGGGNF